MNTHTPVNKLSTSITLFAANGSCSAVYCHDKVVGVMADITNQIWTNNGWCEHTKRVSTVLANGG